MGGLLLRAMVIVFPHRDKERLFNRQRSLAINGSVGILTRNTKGELAGEPGFEPGLTESESVGLPLTYSPAGEP